MASWVNQAIDFLDRLYVALRTAFKPPAIQPLPTVPQPPPAPVQAPEPVPVTSTVPSTVPAPPALDWTTPKGAFHAARVTADNAGLTIAQKDILCACIYQESRFLNRHADGTPITNANRDLSGQVWSTDWGIVQVNDYYHIGPGKDFASVAFVMDHPEKVVAWMARILKNTGALSPWSSFASGAYKQWLSTNSPMWLLRS